MHISAAYVLVVLIWATTPLTIKWGGEGSGFLVAVTIRMGIGLICTAILMAVLGIRWLWHRKAILTYLAGALGVFGAMTCVYWSAQFIPSGWISVIFGISPIVTALLAGRLLDEQRLSRRRFLAMILGLYGLALMYEVAVDFGRDAAMGVAGVLVSALLHGVSAVLIKRIDADIPALVSTGGSLLVSLPLFALAWGLFGQSWPVQISDRGLAAIVYTGIVATTLGFSLYYFVLKNLPAIRVSLIALMSPMLALWLGNVLNQEPLTDQILLGSGLILISLLIFETGQGDSGKSGEDE